MYRKFTPHVCHLFFRYWGRRLGREAWAGIVFMQLCTVLGELGLLTVFCGFSASSRLILYFLSQMEH
jgi:hypothetical protein